MGKGNAKSVNQKLTEQNIVFVENNFKEQKPASVLEQKSYWVSRFPQLDATHIERLAARISCCKLGRILVFPKRHRVTKTDQYEKAFYAIGDLIIKDRPFYNYRHKDHQFDNLDLWTETALEKMVNKTPGDYLVMEVIYTNGRSFTVEEARSHFLGKEFALGPYEIACDLLVNPGAFFDEYKCTQVRAHVHLGFLDGAIFSYCWVGNAYTIHLEASGYIPKIR